MKFEQVRILSAESLLKSFTSVSVDITQKTILIMDAEGKDVLFTVEGVEFVGMSRETMKFKGYLPTKRPSLVRPVTIAFCRP